MAKKYSADDKIVDDDGAAAIIEFFLSAPSWINRGLCVEQGLLMTNSHEEINALCPNCPVRDVCSYSSVSSAATKDKG